MSAESPLIKSMRTAVAATPDDVPLRLHLAELLMTAGHGDAAVGEVAAALQQAPGDVQARELMVRALAGTPAITPAAAAPPLPPHTPVPAQPPAPAAVSPQDSVVEPSSAPASSPGFDWKAAQDQVGDAVPPRFVEAPLTVDGGGDPGGAAAWDVERPGTVRLADVGGMQEVKERLEAAFLAPVAQPGAAPPVRQESARRATAVRAARLR